MEKTNFEKLIVYKPAENLADLVWNIVYDWKILEKNTIGIQLIRACDSIGANIAEGTGRGSANDNRRFARIARGSLFESKHWLRRAVRRNLLTQKQIIEIKPIIDELSPKLSAYINSIKKNN